MSFLPAPLRRFLRDDRGLVLAETVIILPFLIWAYLAMVVFWDAFRSVNTVQKASYAVADMISRQGQVDMAFINGLRATMSYLVATDAVPSLRVTSVVWSQARNRFEVQWSRSTGTTGTARPQLTTATLQPFAPRIPAMTDGDTVVLVETQVEYTPALNYKLTGQTLNQFIVTRPRFTNRVCFVGVNCT